MFQHNSKGVNNKTLVLEEKKHIRTVVRIVKPAS